MKENSNRLLKDGIENINDYSLSIRFKARRAILNAVTQAKITDGTYDPEPFKCTRPRNAVPFAHLMNSNEENEKDLR